MKNGEIMKTGIKINFQKKSRIAQRKVYDVDLQSIVR